VQQHVRHVKGSKQQSQQLTQDIRGRSTESLDLDVVDGDIKIIGLGQQGISATLRLMGAAADMQHRLSSCHQQKSNPSVIN
jgi:uncharacterized protein Smg (DUF494 family)